MRLRPSSAVAFTRRNAAALVVAAIGVIATAVSWAATARTIAAQQEARFGEVTRASTSALRDRLEAYVAMLRAARGFVDGLGRPPTATEWRLFARSLELHRQFPGAQGLGWAVALEPDEVAAHVAAERAAGRPGYRVWPEGDRRLYSAIVHLEPPDWRNQRAIGFDMFSEPVRRAAMSRADTTGDAAATGRVELVQEAGSDRQAGFLVYVAVHEVPLDLDSRLLGWVYAPFRANDLLHRTLGVDHTPAVGLAVYDGAGLETSELLLDEGGAGRGDRVAEDRIQVAGRTLLLRYVSEPGFATATEQLAPFAVLAAVAALSTLVLWITRGEAERRGRAERQARRTAFLAGAGRALASTLDYRRSVGRAARFAAGRVADLCVFVVLEPEGPVWRVGHRDPGLARRLEGALAAAELDLAEAPGRHRDRRTRLPFARATPEVAALLAEAGVAEAIRAPLHARGETLGAVALLARKGSFRRADEALVEDLARAASAAIDTSRLFRQAEEAVSARDEFLSIASHELKTPLTSLGLQADSLLLAARRAGTQAMIHKAEVVRRNVDRLTGLVARLLDISRLSAGRLELDLAEADLAEVAREVVEKFEEEAARSGTRIVLDAPERLAGRWDRVRLDQVLTNLLSNAVKYGPGKPVDVRLEDRGDRAALTVRDRGIGISPEDQARIFERFERAVSRRHYGGFGLGLWIVRQLVEAMGGAVRVESAAGEGAAFHVELPVDQAAARPERHADRPAAPAH